MEDVVANAHLMLSHPNVGLPLATFGLRLFERIRVTIVGFGRGRGRPGPNAARSDTVADVWRLRVTPRSDTVAAVWLDSPLVLERSSTAIPLLPNGVVLIALIASNSSLNRSTSDLLSGCISSSRSLDFDFFRRGGTH